MGGVGRGRVEKGEVGRGRASRVGRSREIRLRRLKSKNRCHERSFIFAIQSKFKLKIM